MKYQKLNADSSNHGPDTDTDESNPRMFEVVEISSKINPINSDGVEGNNQLIFKVINGEKIYEVNELSSTSRITQLKNVIHAISNVPNHRQRLIYKGKALKPDDKTLGHFSVVTGSSVHLFPLPEIKHPTNGIFHDA